MVIVPLLQIAWTLFSIVSGMLYFQEYKGFTMLKAIMLPVGVAVRGGGQMRAAGPRADEGGGPKDKGMRLVGPEGHLKNNSLSDGLGK